MHELKYSDLAQTEYQQRLKSIQESYDERVKSLSMHVSRFLNDIDQDEVYNAMRENSLSNDFAIDHVRELLQETLAHEKELTISKLQQEIASLKSSQNHLIASETSSKQKEIEEKDKYLSEIINHLNHSSNLVKQLKKKLIQKTQKIEELEKSHKQANEKYDSTIDRFQKAFAEIENDVIDKERVVHSQHESEIEKIHADYEKIIQEKTKEISELSKSISKQDASENLKSQYIADLKELELQHINETSALKTQIEKLQILLDSSKSDNKQLRSLSDSYKDAYDEKKEVLESKMKGLEKDRAEALKQLELACSTIDELNSEKDALKDHISQLQAMLSDQQEQSNNLTSTLKTTRNKHAEELLNMIDKSMYLNEKASFEHKLEEYDSIALKLKANVHDQQFEIDRLTNDLDNKNKKIYSLQNEIERLENENRNITGSLRNKDSDVEEYKEALRSLENKLSSEKKKRFSMLKQVHTKLRSEIKPIRSSILKLNEDIQKDNYDMKNLIWKTTQEIVMKLMYNTRNSRRASVAKVHKTPESIDLDLKSDQSLKDSSYLRNFSKNEEVLPKTLKINHLKHRVSELQKEMNLMKDNESKLKNTRKKHNESMENLRQKYKIKIKGLKDKILELQAHIDQINLDLEHSQTRNSELKENHTAEVLIFEDRIKDLEKFLDEERVQKETIAKIRAADIEELTKKIKYYKDQLKHNKKYS